MGCVIRAACVHVTYSSACSSQMVRFATANSSSRAYTAQAEPRGGGGRGVREAPAPPLCLPRALPRSSGSPRPAPA